MCDTIYFFSPALKKNKTGWSRFVKQLSQELKENINIKIITCKGESLNSGEKHEIKEIPLKYKKSNFPLISFIYFIYGLIHIKKQSIIFFPNFYYYFLPLVYLKKFKKHKIFIRICGPELNTSKLVSLKIKALKQINKIIVLNNVTYQQLLNKKLTNVEFIPNYIDSQEFDSRIKINYNLSNPIKILFVGNVVKMKGVEDLFWVIKNSKYKKNIKLDIIGDYNKEPEYFSRLKILKEKHNLNVIFKDILDKTTLVSSYRLYDLFVLPSHLEGMSNVILEAMATGLPVLASNIPGITENIIHKENGYLFDIEDKKGFQNTFNLLIENYHIRKYIGENARIFIRERRAKEKIISIYKKILLYN